MKKYSGKRYNPVVAFVCNMMLVYVSYFICRVAYVLENWSTFGVALSDNSLSDLLCGSLLFDTSAILYTNILYAVMMLLPIHFKTIGSFGRIWQGIAKWIFVIVNAIAMVMNLGDSVYFKYTGKRTTMSVLGEFSNESNLGSIFGVEILRHWYLLLLGLLLIISLWKLYFMPKVVEKTSVRGKKLALWCLGSTILLAAYAGLSVAGMRGGFTTAVRPITISNANQYVNHPTEAAMVLNTPFSLIRTIGKTVFVDPGFFTSEELDNIYSPLHNVGQNVSGVVNEGDSTNVKRTKNVVVLIVESFGREYIGKYNENLENGKYKGYTPFVDSLLSVSLSFDYTFANGRQSIDGMPSILSGIPRFIEPFFLTPSSLNDVSGLAGELGKIGYSSAFFHGAENGSMGFEAFARTTGYDRYLGRTEFNQDKRFDGDKDFDGTWAIWDEPFLQFYALKMSEMKEPFVTTIFTASSHHPYVVPEKYSNIYKDEPVPQAKGVISKTNPIHKCIRYTDEALRRFFATARKQPWFENTIFVFTSDHTNIYDHEEYGTDLGLFGAPIFFYDPSGEMPRERRHCIAQQTDIMPTVLGWLGYDKPYVAWGVNLFATADEDTWAVNHTGSGMYQFVKGDYLLQFDGQQLKAVYDIKKDWLLKHNLYAEKKDDAVVRSYEKQLKAIIQSYMQRMLNNELVVR